MKFQKLVWRPTVIAWRFELVHARTGDVLAIAENGGGGIKLHIQGPTGLILKYPNRLMCRRVVEKNLEAWFPGKGYTENGKTT